MVREEGEEAFSQMLAAGLLDADLVTEFQASRASYKSAQEELLARQTEFVLLDARLAEHFEVISILFEAAAVAASSEMEYLSKIPNKKFSWNTGLKDKWTIADQVSVANLSILSRLHQYDLLIRGGDPDQIRKRIDHLNQNLEQVRKGVIGSKILNKLKV